MYILYCLHTYLFITHISTPSLDNNITMDTAHTADSYEKEELDNTE